MNTLPLGSLQTSFLPSPLFLTLGCPLLFASNSDGHLFDGEIFVGFAEGFLRTLGDAETAAIIFFLVNFDDLPKCDVQSSFSLWMRDNPLLY